MSELRYEVRTITDAGDAVLVGVWLSTWAW
jgi:hypothetical protein